LIYAIGEIVLVVIGILIALQINNWNDSKKNLSVLKNYKERLYRQFKSDSISLANFNRAFEFQQPIFQNLDITFRENYKGNVSIDSIIKVPLFITLQSEFISATTVIDELFNTGNLDLFSNDELKDLLAGYKQLILQQHDMIGRTKNKFDDFDKLLSRVSKYTEREYLIKASEINTDYFMNQYWMINASRLGQKMHFDNLEKMNNDILILLK
jgi:hypothetical protein